MRRAIYLVTRDNYLVYGIKKTFAETHFSRLALEVLPPADFHQISAAHTKYDLVYLMADEDILRFIRFHHPCLNVVQIPSCCCPVDLVALLRQGTRQHSRERLLAENKSGSQFTQRETEILRYLKKGMAPCEIAQQIQRSEKTVSHYKRLIMEKTGCKSHLQLIELLHSAPVVQEPLSLLHK